ncbi:MAG: DUF4124 domain-containing protein [Nitrosospira sp.]|nr:DUF4124 domain-containing protein [Nitrosospira sp.]
MATTAFAEIYKHVDKEGRITYSNTPTKGAKKLYLDPAAAQPRPKVTTPEGFPKVARKVQQQRDVKRREILAEELAAEEMLLSDARQALKKGEVNYQALKVSPAQSRHNVVNSEEQMKKLQEQVLLHENNIVALKRELAN